MTQFVQATSVEIEGQAVLIQGPAGVGKTSLALKLIERGGNLICDDITVLSLKNNRIFCKVQEKLYGKIELKGLGIIQNMAVCQEAPLVCVIRLHADKTERFPEADQKIEILGQKIPVFDFFSCETTYLWVLYALKALKGELSLLKE